jgi:hypothetical protein
MLSFGALLTLPNEMSIERRAAAGLRKKGLGNTAYKDGDLRKALQLYGKALEYTEGETTRDTDAAVLEGLKKTRRDCANNIVQVTPLLLPLIKHALTIKST